MSLKRVNPTDVQAYGTAAQGYFDNIFTSLTTLCDNVVGVHYFGTNAYQFKYDAGELAEAFARGMATDLGNLADGIRKTTSNIAGSLGGQAISISVSGKPINAAGAATRHGHPGGRSVRAHRLDHDRRHPLQRDQRRDDGPSDAAAEHRLEGRRQGRHGRPRRRVDDEGEGQGDGGADQAGRLHQQADRAGQRRRRRPERRDRSSDDDRCSAPSVELTVYGEAAASDANVVFPFDLALPAARDLWELAQSVRTSKTDLRPPRGRWRRGRVRTATRSTPR